MGNYPQKLFLQMFLFLRFNCFTIFFWCFSACAYFINFIFLLFLFVTFLFGPFFLFLFPVLLCFVHNRGEFFVIEKMFSLWQWNKTEIISVFTYYPFYINCLCLFSCDLSYFLFLWWKVIYINRQCEKLLIVMYFFH